MKHLGTIWSVGFSPDGRSSNWGGRPYGPALERVDRRALGSSSGTPGDGWGRRLQHEWGNCHRGPVWTDPAVWASGKSRRRPHLHARNRLGRGCCLHPGRQNNSNRGRQPKPYCALQGFVRLWDRFTGQALGDPVPYDHPVLAVAFNPDGTKVLTGCGYPYRNIGGAYLRSLDPGDSSIIKFKHDYNPVWSVAFSPGRPDRGDCGLRSEKP